MSDESLKEDARNGRTPVMPGGMSMLAAEPMFCRKINLSGTGLDFLK
jgi:hypothetical protein